MNCDIVGLTESWHTSNKLCSDMFGKSFVIFDSKAIKEKSKGRPSGGIVLMINKSLNPNKIDLIESNCFYIAIELSINNSSLIVVCFYLSPSVCDETCAETLENCLIELESRTESNIVILGDLNARFGNLNQLAEESIELDNHLLSKERTTNDQTANKRGILLCELFESYGITRLREIRLFLLLSKSLRVELMNYCFKSPQPKFQPQIRSKIAHLIK